MEQFNIGGIFANLGQIPIRLMADGQRILFFGLTNIATDMLLPPLVSAISPAGGMGRTFIGGLASGVTDDIKFIANDLSKTAS